MNGDWEMIADILLLAATVVLWQILHGGKYHAGIILCSGLVVLFGVKLIWFLIDPGEWVTKLLW